MSEREDERLSAFWAWLDVVFSGVLILGILLLVVSWRPAAVLVVGGLGGLFAGHVAIGAVAYRRTMRRPWPKVEPVPDDDWDD